jgi:carboxyl-terminal processing protease
VLLRSPSRRRARHPKLEGRVHLGPERQPRLRRATLALFLALAGGAAALRAQAPSDAELQKTVVDLVQSMEEQPLEALWKSVARLERLSAETVVPVLLEEIQRAGERAKLGCAKAIVQLGQADDKKAGLDALDELVRKSKKVEVRVAAVKLLGEFGEPEELLEFFQDLLEKETDPELSIALSRALWDIDHVPAARQKLISLLDSRDPMVRYAAAMALAEIEYFEGDVRDLLRELAQQPTLEGRLAASLLRSGQLARQLDTMIDAGAALPGADLKALLMKKESRIRELEITLDDLRRQRPAARDGRDDGATAVFKEVIRRIEELYVERGRVKRSDLVIAALKGMARSLDPFSSFLDPGETKRFLSDISGEYPGIGAQVGKQQLEAPLEVIKPVYNGPAYKAGVLTGDQILEIDGFSTRERSVEEIVERLKGAPGSTVLLTVFRRGWEEPRTIELVRQTIEVPSVAYSLLPGKIGLIRISQFGEKSFEEFKAALDALHADAVEGLILDLRNNPGGLLTAALNVVDLFVGEEELPIVTQKGPDEKDGVEQTFPDAAQMLDPLVVLIDQRSASASEIVAGALKDYHRATVVGKRSFGKGSVQRLIPLTEESEKFLGGESRLRLTVQYYYLPSGRCVHSIRDETGKELPGQEGGVVPDVEVESPDLSGLVDQIEELRSSKKLAEFAQTHFEELKSLVAKGDGGEDSRYPGFDELYRSLETQAPKDLVRRMLRFQLRRRFEDSIGRELAGDFQDDVLLQRGILELLRKLARDPEKDPDYAWLVKKG